MFVGNELVEEDVDIGGNDLPPLTYPPAVFESETAERSSKHSTSSSSSSDSESSSSGMLFMQSIIVLQSLTFCLHFSSDAEFSNMFSAAWAL